MTNTARLLLIQHGPRQGGLFQAAEEMPPTMLLCHAHFHIEDLRRYHRCIIVEATFCFIAKILP